MDLAGDVQFLAVHIEDRDLHRRLVRARKLHDRDAIAGRPGRHAGALGDLAEEFVGASARFLRLLEVARREPPETAIHEAVAVATVELPSAYRLEQNYPNPFNPSTTIKYALPEDTFVDIVIYNMLGQRIRTLVSQEHKAGRYDVIWDATDFGGRPVGSGVYYYMIKTDNFKASKKMVFLK